MKKSFAFLLALLIVLSVFLCACSNGGDKLGKGIKIGVVYKQSDSPYFKACVEGFQKAADELGFKFIHSGPEDGSAAGQEKIIRDYMKQNVDVLCISANDADALAGVCKEAKEKGIKVISWDSELTPSSRDFHVAAASPRKIGLTQLDFISGEMNNEGKLAIISASETSPNQNLWISYIEDALKNNDKYKNIEFVGTFYGDDDYTKSYDVCKELIKQYPDLKGIIVPSTNGAPGVAKCLTDEGKAGQIKMTGLTLAHDMVEYIKSGVAPATFLWNPTDLGYVTAHLSVGYVKERFPLEDGAKAYVEGFDYLNIFKMDDGSVSIFIEMMNKFDSTTVDEWKDII